MEKSRSLRQIGINIGTVSEATMEESVVIKNLDKELREFAGANTGHGSIDEVFSDSKRYRRLADSFWNTRVVKAPRKAA